MKRLTLVDLFKEGYTEGKKHLPEHGGMLPSEANDSIAAAYGEAYSWINCYDRGETIYEPSAHNLKERLGLCNIWAQGYLAGAES